VPVSTGEVCAHYKACSHVDVNVKVDSTGMLHRLQTEYIRLVGEMRKRLPMYTIWDLCTNQGEMREEKLHPWSSGKILVMAECVSRTIFDGSKECCRAAEGGGVPRSLDSQVDLCRAEVDYSTPYSQISIVR
jgi:hypothetical protein